MIYQRGEIWFAELNPVQGSEQAGTRPVIIFQNDIINKYSSTVLAIPLTTNLRRANLPTCVLISKQESNLQEDSVALCHQLRVLDKKRLIHPAGNLSGEVIEEIEKSVLFTLGIF